MTSLRTPTFVVRATSSVLLVLLVGCGRSASRDSQLADADRLSGIEKQIAGLSKKVDALCGAGAANITPAASADNPGPSTNLLTRVSALEGKVANKSQWPKSIEGAKQLRESYEAIASEVPVAMPFEISKRLRALRWNIEAISYLATDGLNKPQEDDFEELESLYRELLATAPEDARADIKAQVQEAMAAAERKARSSRLSDATTSARAAIGAAASTASASSSPATQAEVSHGLELAFNKLEPFKDDAVAKGLRGQIERLVSEREIEEQLKRISGTLDIAEKSKDTRIRQAGVLRAMGEAIELYYRLAGETSTAINGDTINRVTSILQRCEDSLADVSAEKKMQKYQSWALEQIKQFDQWQFDSALADVKAEFASFQSPAASVDWELITTFPAVRKLLSEKTGVEIRGSSLGIEAQSAIYQKVYGRLSWAYADDLAYCATREAMKKYLLPIDVRLLDPPVARFYEKSFAKAWQKLEDRPEECQLDVAKADATVHKRTLDDF